MSQTEATRSQRRVITKQPSEMLNDPPFLTTSPHPQVAHEAPRGCQSAISITAFTGTDGACQTCMTGHILCVCVCPFCAVPCAHLHVRVSAHYLLVQVFPNGK